MKVDGLNISKLQEWNVLMSQRIRCFTNESIRLLILLTLNWLILLKFLSLLQLGVLFLYWMKNRLLNQIWFLKMVKFNIFEFQTREGIQTFEINKDSILSSFYMEMEETFRSKNWRFQMTLLCFHFVKMIIFTTFILKNL